MAALTYFTVNAYGISVNVDYTDEGVDPDLQPITATVTFKPRVGVGSLLQAPSYTTPALVALPPIVARLDEDGKLHTVAGDLGVRLVANTPVLGLSGDLIYDVIWSNVKYNKKSQTISPFGFVAPTSDTPVDLASVTRVPIVPGSI